MYQQAWAAGILARWPTCPSGATERWRSCRWSAPERPMRSRFFHGGPRRPKRGALRSPLARSRGSLACVCRCARGADARRLGDVAFTARARAVVVAESIDGAANVAAVALEVEFVEDHGRADFEILDGGCWRWVDEGGAEARRPASRRAARAETSRLTATACATAGYPSTSSRDGRWAQPLIDAAILRSSTAVLSAWSRCAEARPCACT